MAAGFKTIASPFRPGINHPQGTGGARSNLALDSAYVHKTSGDVVAIRYEAPTTDTIDALYVFMDAHGGTIGNITMEAAIYNESAAAVPGTTQRDVSTATVIPNADDKWIKFTFGTPYTPTKGEILWFVVYNTSASPTVDFPNVMITTSASPYIAPNQMVGYSSTAGLSTAGTQRVTLPFVVTQGSNHFGQPFTQINVAYYTSNQLKRGFAFTMPATALFYGVAFQASSTTLSGVQIFTSAQNPNDSPAHGYSTGADANETTDELVGAKLFDTSITLTAGASYKCVLTFASNSQSPAVLQIEDYASYSAVFDAMYDQSSYCWGVIDNGANGWTTDKSISPCIQLLMESIPWPTLPIAAQVLNGIQFGEGGTEFTGTVVLPAIQNVLLNVAFGAGGAQAGIYTEPNVGDVRLDSTFGPIGTEQVGTLVLPIEDDVELGVGYGTNGTELTGGLVAGGGNPRLINGGLIR